MGGFGVSRGTPAECSKPGRCVDGEMRNCEAKKAQDLDADQSCSGCQTPAERRRPGRRPLPRAERGLPYRSESPGDWHIVHRGHTNWFMPGPVRWFRAVIAAVGIFASGTACLGQTQQRYPGTSWQQLSPRSPAGRPNGSPRQKNGLAPSVPRPSLSCNMGRSWRPGETLTLISS